MEMRMIFITRYIGIFTQKTFNAMLFAVFQIWLICSPSLALAQLPTVNLTVGDGVASEAGPDPGSYTFTRSNNGIISQALQLGVDVGGKAIFGTDYSTSPDMVRLGGTVYRVTIQPDQLTATVIITPIQDGKNEGDETVVFTLVDDGVTYDIGPDTVAQITIADDVPEVNLTVGDGVASEAGPDPGSYTFTRSNNGIISQALQLGVDVGGKAIFGTDYSTSPDMVRLGGTVYRVTIQPDQLTATVIITPIQDGKNEGDETVIFTLVDSTTYIVGPNAEGRLTIADFVEGIFKDSFEDL